MSSWPTNFVKMRLAWMILLRTGFVKLPPPLTADQSTAEIPILSHSCIACFFWLLFLVYKLRAVLLKGIPPVFFSLYLLIHLPVILINKGWNALTVDAVIIQSCVKQVRMYYRSGTGGTLLQIAGHTLRAH